MKLFLTNRERLLSVGAFLVDELDSLVSRIRGAWHVEHNEDDTHGHVHADSLATGRLTYSDIVTASIAVDRVDNYDPGMDTAAIVRLNPSVSLATVTGLQVPRDEQGTVLDGRVLVLENVSQANTIVLSHENSSSLPRNRITTPLVDVSTSVAARHYLPPGSLLALVYNASKARWTIQSRSNEDNVKSTTLTGTNNDLAIDGWTRIFRVDFSASAGTITGFSSTNIPEAARKTVVNAGVYAFDILHQNTGSLSANRVQCPGGVRYRVHPRESVELLRTSNGWRIAEKADQWIDVTFAAGNFTTDTGTWTVASGDQTTYAWQLDGNKMTVAFDLRTTTVATSPTQLRIAVPASKTIARTVSVPVLAADNGTQIQTAYVQALAGNTYLQVFKDLAATAWAAATDATQLRGEIAFMVRDDCGSISEVHTDVAAVNIAHGDSEHSDVHADSGAHTDSHSDVSHQDASHSDTHADTSSHSDTHGDTSSHDDVAHSDSHDDVAHADSAGSHTDNHLDQHGDETFEEHPEEHVDSHTDQHDDVTVSHGDSHTDSHSDVAHSDSSDHTDTHSDTSSHSDTHTDSSHTDSPHSDTHADSGTHSDSHTDQAAVNTAHGDTPHDDVGYHCDTAHSDI